MYSGIVEGLGIVKDVKKKGRGIVLSVNLGRIRTDAKLGDSISINGVCLTVSEISKNVVSFDCIPETMKKTNLGKLKAGNKVNVEYSLKLGDTLNGHFVIGHVDCTSTILKKETSKGFAKLWIESGKIKEFLAKKGSVAVDGVGLTVVDIKDDKFSVECTPTTLKLTTLGFKKEGDEVNLEADVLARYVRNFIK